jgi:SNF2 family DNA or RNA helicase
VVELHDYQRFAVDHLHRNPHAGLFLDMGLGKTAVTLSAMTPEHFPALVIAPKRVAENVWPKEVLKWRPDLKMRVAKGRPSQRLDQLGSAADVYVISRDNFGDALAYEGQWKTIVFDELSGFKSHRSQRFKTAKKLLSHEVPYVWGLTGTPTPNGLLDLWSQMYLLDKGERLGRTITSYRERYFTVGNRLPNGIVTRYDLRPGAEKRIHMLIDDICLSMDSDTRLDLPEVTHNKVVVPMTPTTRAAYRKMKQDLVMNLDLLGGTETFSAANTAVLSSKLAQVSAGFIFVDDAEIHGNQYRIIHHDKTTTLQEIVEGTGSPVLVFYRFVPEAEMIRKAMPGLTHNIDEPGVIDAWNRGEIPVLLTHPQSAGHGLNLQEGPGHTIVWSSLPWSLEEWDQGNGRLDRQGQKNQVVIHVLSTPNTVDEKIYTALRNKTSVQDALLEHLESPL